MAHRVELTFFAVLVPLSIGVALLSDYSLHASPYDSSHYEPATCTLRELALQSTEKVTTPRQSHSRTETPSRCLGHVTVM